MSAYAGNIAEEFDGLCKVVKESPREGYQQRYHELRQELLDFTLAESVGFERKVIKWFAALGFTDPQQRAKAQAKKYESKAKECEALLSTGELQDSEQGSIKALKESYLRRVAALETCVRKDELIAKTLNVMPSNVIGYECALLSMIQGYEQALERVYSN